MTGGGGGWVRRRSDGVVMADGVDNGYGCFWGLMISSGIYSSGGDGLW